MKLFINKLWWLILTAIGYGILCFILELPLATVVYAIIDKEDPSLLSLVTLCVSAVLMIILIYQKRLRNDPKRREYLTDVHRQYGSFKKDCLYILRSREFQAEAVVLSLPVIAFIVYCCTVPFIVDVDYALWIKILWILLCIAGGGLAVSLLWAGRLLMHNRAHRVWIDDLIVPDQTEEAMELARKKASMKRNIAFQFGFSALFFVLYALNTYAVTFAVVVTPPIFVYTQVQGIMGIIHLRNIDQPYKKFVRLQIIAFAVYVGSLLFGAFSPKI